MGEAGLEDREEQGRAVNETVGRLALTLFVVAVGALFGWVLYMQGRISAFEIMTSALSDRIGNVEQGRTLPMSNESRARIENEERRIEHLETSFERLEASVANLRERTPQR